MHPYIPHLLSDIREAQRRNVLHVEEEAPPTIDEHLEAVERWIAGEEPEHTFGYYCGLERINFPHAEQLSDHDLIQVCHALQDLLSSWHAGIDLPEALPLPMKYQFMVGTLDEGFTVMNSGQVTFDYCSGYAPECSFKEYCPCLEFWKKTDDPMDHSSEC
jgi:hypothetical protein